MSWEVPLFDLRLGQREEEAVLAVIRSGWLTQSKRVEQFERAFARKIGARFACAVSSCTAGLHLVASALGIGPGDEVIVPSLTFVATVSTIVQLGARPIFADIESSGRPLVDARDIERKTTDRTRAVVVTHYAGHPCNMTDIVEVATRHGLHLIEDCAHAPLALWEGRCVGTFGIAGVFSFYSNKNLSTGEGGMIVTDDADLADRLALLRSHAMTRPTMHRHAGHAFDYDVVDLGFNYRFDEMRAALGLAQLERLEENNALRAQCAARYRELLADIDWIEIPFRGEPRAHGVWHIFPVLLGEGAPPRRRIMEHLRERGIQTSIHYRPVHQFSFYQRRFATPDRMLPRTSALAPRLLTLPLYPTLTVEQQELVVSALSECG